MVIYHEFTSIFIILLFLSETGFYKPMPKGEENALDFEDIESKIGVVTSFNEQIKILMNECVLTDLEIEERMEVVRELEIYIHSRFYNCSLKLFESLVSGLGIKGSDVDLQLNLRTCDNGTSGITNFQYKGFDATIEILKLLEIELLQNEKLTEVELIPARRVPILRFKHKTASIHGDISLGNHKSVVSTKLIRMYLDVDTRLKPLLITLRYWVQKNHLSGRGGMSNYALALMMLFYLQRQPVPGIPTLRDIRLSCATDAEKVVIDGWDCTIPENLTCVPKFNNTESVLELFCGFFHFCASFDFQSRVLCSLTGEDIEREMFGKTRFEELPNDLERYKSYMRKKGSESLNVDEKYNIVLQELLELSVNKCEGVNDATYKSLREHCLASNGKCEDIVQNNDKDGILAIFN